MAQGRGAAVQTVTTPAATRPPRRNAGAAALARRIAAFAGVPFLALLAPFVFLPVLARLAGADVWVAIALGQSVGGIAAIVAGLGYSTLAPPIVAVASPEQRRRLVATSVHVRVPVWGVAALVAVVVAAALAPGGSRTEAGAMAATMSLAGLAPTWYWIGVGRALPILWAEVLPRMAATLAATGLLVVGAGPLWYPILLAVAMIAGPAVIYWRIASLELVQVERDEVIAVLRRHPPALIAETAGGAYNALAVTLVTAVAPVAQAARYVSGDKAYRIGQYSVSALGNALQGWVVEAGPGRVGRRLRIVVALHGSLGVVGCVALGLSGPWLTRLLFGSSVAVSEATAWGFGVAILGITLGTAFGRIGLITIGARKAFMSCVVCAAIVGVLGLLIGGSLWGANGGAWALGMTEVLSALAQGSVLAVLWRRRHRRR